MDADPSPEPSQEPGLGIYGSPNPEWILHMMDYVAYGMIKREEVDLVADEVHVVGDAGCCVRCGPVGLFGWPCWMHRIATYARFLKDSGVDIEKRG